MLKVYPFNYAIMQSFATVDFKKWTKSCVTMWKDVRQIKII